MKPTSAPVTVELIEAYVALNFIGIFLLLALVSTILFARKTRIQRDPTLLNCLFVLIFVNAVNLMYWLVSQGKYDEAYAIDSLPPYVELCRGQASILAGAPCAQAAAVLAMIIRVGLDRTDSTKFRTRQQN